MSKESKTTQENKPPAWATPLFKESASEGLDLYRSGAGGNTYMGDTVAPLSDTTQQGVNQLTQAGQGWDTAGTRSMFENIGNRASGPSYAEQNLSGIASGQDNPYFEDALQGQLDSTAAQVQSLMSGAGRMGSGANTGVLTNRLGNIRSSALSDQWNQNIQNQLAATGQMDSARFGGMDRSMQATGAMAGLDQQNFTNRLAGAGATLDAGNILDTQSQRELTDDVNRWYAKDNEDWTRLGLLQSAAAGSAGPYGTQVATQRQPFNPLSAISPLFGGK